MFRRITALAAGAVLAAALALAVTWPARATTATCTNVATPVTQPIGCGGIFLPLLGSGIQPNATSRTLTAASPSWNSPVTLSPYDPARSDQDLTVYEVCAFAVGNSPVSPSPTGTIPGPCGTNGAPVIDPLSGFNEYVAEVTPLGQHLGGTLNSLGNLCLSVQGVRNGPRHGLRWHVVLRTCNTYGAHFTAGSPSGLTHGIAGVVNLANRFQTWSPIPAAGGYVLGNNALSNNFRNTPFVLDDAAFRPGGPLLAYPENDGANQVWKVIGCTDPVTQLTPGFFACP
jgi:hypothetical protein